MIYMNKFKIQNFEISKDNPPFIIAEAGINHNGDIKRALEMIKVAKNSGVTAIKFQTFKASSLVTEKTEKAIYQKQHTPESESHFEMIKNLELSQEDHSYLVDSCNKNSIEWIMFKFKNIFLWRVRCRNYIWFVNNNVRSFRLNRITNYLRFS